MGAERGDVVKLTADVILHVYGVGKEVSIAMEYELYCVHSISLCIKPLIATRLYVTTFHL